MRSIRSITCPSHVSVSEPTAFPYDQYTSSSCYSETSTCYLPMLGRYPEAKSLTLVSVSPSFVKGPGYHQNRPQLGPEIGTKTGISGSKYGGEQAQAVERHISDQSLSRHREREITKGSTQRFGGINSTHLGPKRRYAS